MRLYRLALCVAFGCVAVPGVTQVTSSPPIEGASADVGEDSLARLPESMFGIQCKSSIAGPGFSGACYDPTKGPVVGFSTYPMGRDLSHEELVERMSKAYEAGKSAQAIEEASFVIRSAPKATTARAIFLSEVGRHFIWSASYRRNLTSVTVSIPPEVTGFTWSDFEAEVMANVFGPDRYVPDVSAAQ